jgi:tetratricopeptide (TPR) repeat protein
MSDVQIETEPRTRILFVEPGDGDRAGQHGYAFYPRWQQCFSVHIHHVREKRATSREAIEKALANLEMNEAADRFKLAHLLALRSNKDPRLPLVLVEAAVDYMQEGPFKNEPLAIRAAGVAFQTAVETKPDDQTFWQVAFTAGSIQIANRRWKDAIASWTKCVELAKTRPNPAHEESLARYNLACTYSRMGRLEAGFEQLEASMALGSEAERANLREHAQKDPDLAKLRTDARWKQLFD